MIHKLKNTNWEPILLTSGILLLIGSLFIPIPVILFAQDILFFSQDHWTLIRHDEAFKGFAAGMAWLGIISFSALFTVMWADKKRKPYRLAALHVALAFLSIPLCLFALFSYSSIEPTRMTHHEFGSFQSQELSFDEMTTMIRHYETEPTRITEISFISANQTLTIPYDPEDSRSVRAIQRVMEAYPVTVIEDGLH